MHATTPHILRRSHLPPRVFQQTCRLASLRQKRGLSSRQPRSPLAGTEQPEEDDSNGIRWFEQDAETGETRAVAGNPEEMEARNVRQKIRKLERELRQYENKGGPTEESLLSPLSPADREKMEKAFIQQREERAALTKGLEVKSEFIEASMSKLKAFNIAVQNAALNKNSEEHRKSLWRWYARCKHSMPMFLENIPAAAWDVLWHSQYIEDETNTDRPAHLATLLADMESVGRELTAEQQVLRLEAVFASGDPGKALDEWERQNASDSTEKSPEFYESGVRMFTAAGKLERAQIIVQEILIQHRDSDPRVAIPLISALNDRARFPQAFALYLQFKERLGRDVTVSDFDAIYLSFLKAEQRELALAVFRDMMLCGTPQSTPRDPSSAWALQQVAHNKISDLQRLSDTSVEANKVFLTALTCLPRAWQNKFFYGKWLKKLIGMRELDAASKVIELMYERGVRPDAGHLNGLITAYFAFDPDPSVRKRALQAQSSGSTNLRRAEQLAWAMILKRLEFVAHHRAVDASEQAVAIDRAKTAVSIPVNIERPVPMATIKTFGALALHYSSEGLVEMLEDLRSLLPAAKLEMDTYFANQMMYGYFHTYKHQHAWYLYVILRRKNLADIETFNCLWKFELQFRYDFNTTRRSNDAFPPPRGLFAEMTRWYFSLSTKRAEEARRDLENLPASINKTFCTALDAPGVLVAMHAMKAMFGVYPDQVMARQITVAVSRLQLKDYDFVPQQNTISRKRRGRPVEEHVNAAATILATLLRRRKDAADIADGIDVGEQERNEESLNLLSEFVRVVLKRTLGGADEAESAISKAKKLMGYDGPTGDKTAADVP
ncbi:hypothetical protein LTR66_003473 [Elasticomyces elasticus]|nr:hypothetical protein LTR66_003473 [Elasticomyces elasticus]